MSSIVEKYIGKVWESGARGPEKFDCWGLIVYILENEFGVEIDEEYYIHGKDTKNIARAYEKAIFGDHWIRQETPTEGSAVALSKGYKIHHAGIWLDNGCLHSCDNSHVVHNSISRLRLNGYNRIEFYRWHML